MSDQLSMFNQTTSEDSSSVTSSPESESGVTRSDSLAGPTTAKSGPDPVLASPSVRPAKAKRSTIRGTFGQSSFGSSRHEDLSFALASRFRVLTASLGSTLCTLTWITRHTPSGFSIPALRASERPTGVSVCIGWPTPTTRDHKQDGPIVKSRMDAATPLETDIRLRSVAQLAGWPTASATDADRGGKMAGWPTPNCNPDAPNMSRNRGANHGGERERISVQALGPAATLAGWPTAKSRDYRTENEASLHNGHPPDLNKAVLLAGWKTPCVPNGGRISGNTTDIGSHRNGTKAQIGLENEAKLSGWPTYLGREAQLTAFGETPIGFLLGPNGWETVPASGQLSAAHSRWLMGLLKEWDDCAVTAMESSRKSRKRS